MASRALLTLGVPLTSLPATGWRNLCSLKYYLIGAGTSLTTLRAMPWLLFEYSSETFRTSLEGWLLHRLTVLYSSFIWYEWELALLESFQCAGTLPRNPMSRVLFPSLDRWVSWGPWGLVLGLHSNRTLGGALPPVATVLSSVLGSSLLSSRNGFEINQHGRVSPSTPDHSLSNLPFCLEELMNMQNAERFLVADWVV